MSQPRVPTRAEILHYFERNSAVERTLVWIEFLILAGLLVFVLDQSRLLENPTESFFGICVACGETFLGLAYFGVQKRRRISDLPADSTIGSYTRDKLLGIVEAVKARLDPSERDTPVFIVRQKQANAAAMRIGFVANLNPLNGVYLNRSLLHLHDSRELQSILGHEFGHSTKYRRVWDQYFFVHQLFAVVVCLCMYQVGFGFAVFFVATFAITYANGMLRGSSSQTIEFLCDDFGAEIAGVIPAMSGLYKVAARVEAELRVQMYALEAKLSGASFSAKRILEIYEEVLPFDTIDPELVKADLERKLASNTRPGISFRGFIEYLRASDSDDVRRQLQATLAELKAMQRLPTISNLKAIHETSTPEEVQELINQLEAEPEKLMFHLPGEGRESSTHPSFRRRLLYLWKNRDEIEAIRDRP